MIEQGISATAGLAQLRENAGIRTQTWYRVYGEVQRSIANAERIATLNPSRRPGGENFAPWAAGHQPGQLAYQVTVTTFDPETGLMGSQQRTVLTKTAITPKTAADRALEQFTGDPGDARYTAIPLGAVVTNLYRMTGAEE